MKNMFSYRARQISDRWSVGGWTSKNEKPLEKKKTCIFSTLPQICSLVFRLQAAPWVF